MRTPSTSSTGSHLRITRPGDLPLAFPTISVDGDTPMFLETTLASARNRSRSGVRPMLGAAALFLIASGACCHAQEEEAVLMTPDLFAHSEWEPSISGSRLADPVRATVQASPIPVIVLQHAAHLRGPLWHTAFVEGGQTSIRSTMPYERCHCYSADGGNGAFVYHLTDNLGLAADGSRISAGATDQPVNLTQYLFGPQASALFGTHVVAFGHVMAGKADVEGQTNVGRTFSNTALALGWGAGVDVVVNRDTSLRLAQVDNFINMLPHSIVRQSDLRLTFGVVFRFGR